MTFFRRWLVASPTMSMRLVTRIMLGTWSVLLTFLSADSFYGIYYNRSVASTRGDVANKSRAEISCLEFNAGLPQLMRHNELRSIRWHGCRWIDRALKKITRCVSEGL
jgi:hypothetical protein